MRVLIRYYRPQPCCGFSLPIVCKGGIPPCLLPGIITTLRRKTPTQHWSVTSRENSLRLPLSWPQDWHEGGSTQDMNREEILQEHLRRDVGMKCLT